jgi:[acyl-carrier-protein] S-malonyltransferase
MVTKKIAFVFPGQGSQSVGMLSELAVEFPIVSETFAHASDVLGYDLWQLVKDGPEELLNQTERTQPALLAAGVSIWQIWQQLNGPLPIIMAGHSLGEYTALVCANALDFRDAISLVADRGKFMQNAVPKGQGAMAAVAGLEETVVSQLCREAAEHEIVTPANYNSIGQVVVAGHTQAVHRLIHLAKQAGAKIAKLLPVSAPSHCSLMQPASEHLAQRLKDITIRTPAIPVVTNVDVCCYQQSSQIADALIRQLYLPVRWVETIQYFGANKIEIIIECGPGKVLGGLNKRISSEMMNFSTSTLDTLKQALQQI